MYSTMFIEAFTIGVISHIFLDMLTVSGVVLFYPVYKKRIGIQMFNNNKLKMESKEMMVMVSFIIIALITYFASL